MSENSNETVVDLGATFEGVKLPETENELVALSAKLPLWQKDTLRRIALHGRLSDADKDTLKSAMYADHSLGTFADELTAFSADHCQATPNAMPVAMLCSIGPVENIGRLAGDQPPLKFAPEGITLIYGDNGSGKSGYIRISKKICRARAEDDLLGNAYAKAHGDPKAKIRWQVEGEAGVKEMDWNPNQPSPVELSTISVFDSKHATMYVDEKRQVAFLPFEVELYKQLAELVSEFAAEVNAEIEACQKAVAALPEQAPGTQAASIVDAVTNAASEDDLPSEDKIRKFAKWDDQDEKQLQELRIQAAASPLHQADIRARCVSALTKLTTDIEKLETALSAEKAKELEQEHASLKAAKEANDLAAQSSFSDLPLDAVGSVAWQNLFKYARKYAGLADPDHEFPYVGEDAKCVLCHQSLDEDAKQRFVRFDNFISGEAAKDFEAKREAYTAAVKALNALRIETGDDAKTKLAEFAALSEDRAQNVEALASFLEAIGARRDAFIHAASTGKFDDIGEAVEFSSVLHNQIKALEAEETQFRNDAKDDDAQNIQARRLAELEGRKSLAENADNLIANRAHQEKWLRLNA